MPNSVFSLDAGFPQFTGQESEKQKVGEIYDYLIQLQQTLRYCLQNLGGDNFNDKELEIIGNTIREPVYLRLTGVESEMSYISLEAGKISARMEDAEGNISQLQSDASGFGSRLEDAEGNIAQLQADATGYSLSVTNGKDSATVSLKAGETVLSSQKIKFEGVVTFTSDKEGRSVIDGGNVYVTNFWSDEAKIGQALFYGTDCGTEIWSKGVRWWSGVRRDGGTWDYTGGIECEGGDITVNAGRAQDGTQYGLILIGGRIDLNGEVYINGDRIVLERSPL